MPCYHPMIRIENTAEFTKAADGHLYHPAKIEKPNDLLQRLEDLKDNIKYNYQIIPCGKCIGCRLEYSREWANRGYLEAKQWDQNWFLTLTYDDEHIEIKDKVDIGDRIIKNPGDWNGTLKPEDWTAFMKALRQEMENKYKKEYEKWIMQPINERGPEPEKPQIRFMACGEYGEEGERPHYHAILFNLNLPVEDLYKPRIINKEIYYQSHIIEKCWKKGICNISEAHWNAIAYTARYITKKVNGEISEEYYAEKGQEKEFFRVSRMPGIGEQYFRDHYKEIYQNDEIIIKNQAGSVRTAPPKYFDRLYEKMDPKGWKEIKARRKKRAEDAAKIKDQTTSNFRLAQLSVEESYQEDRTKKLVREFEKKAK